MQENKTNGNAIYWLIGLMVIALIWLWSIDSKLEQIELRTKEINNTVSDTQYDLARVKRAVEYTEYRTDDCVSAAEEASSYAANCSGGY